MAIVLIPLILHTSRFQSRSHVNCVEKADRRIKGSKGVGIKEEGVSVVDFAAKDIAIINISATGCCIGGWTVCLTVHKEIVGIVVELCNIVGSQGDMVNLDTYRDGSNCSCGVEDLCDPQPHVD